MGKGKHGDSNGDRGSLVLFDQTAGHEEPRRSVYQILKKGYHKESLRCMHITTV